MSDYVEYRSYLSASRFHDIEGILRDIARVTDTVFILESNRTTFLSRRVDYRIVARNQFAMNQFKSILIRTIDKNVIDTFSTTCPVIQGDINEKYDGFQWILTYQLQGKRWSNVEGILRQIVDHVEVEDYLIQIVKEHLFTADEYRITVHLNERQKNIFKSIMKKTFGL